MRAVGAGVPAVSLRAEVQPADLRRPVPHPNPERTANCRCEKTRRAAGRPPLSRASPRWEKFGLSHNQFVALDIETRARRWPGIGIVHRRRARLHNERPQLSKVVTLIIKIGEAIPPQETFAGTLFAPHRAAKGRPQPGIVLAILMATKAPTLLVGNDSGQILLGRVACHRVMAADEIERTHKTTLTAAIAQAAFYPTLAIAEELQQPVQDFDGFCGVVMNRAASTGSVRSASITLGFG